MESAHDGFADSILKLNNNDFVVYSYNSTTTASDQLTIRSYIKNWLNNTSGPEIQAFSTSGITGHASLSNAILGYTTFDDVALSGTNQVIIKYTYRGDADLDGDVDLNDLGFYSANFTGDGGSTSKTWMDADWDHDGDVDLNDLGWYSSAFTGDLGYGEDALAWEDQS